MMLQASRPSARAAGTHVKLELDREFAKVALQKRTPDLGTRSRFPSVSKVIVLDVKADMPKR
jgi:hypothetical protein